MKPDFKISASHLSWLITPTEKWQQIYNKYFFAIEKIESETEWKATTEHG